MKGLTVSSEYCETVNCLGVKGKLVELNSFYHFISYSSQKGDLVVVIKKYKNDILSRRILSKCIIYYVNKNLDFHLICLEN